MDKAQKGKAIKTALASFGMSGQVFHGPLLRADQNFEVVSVHERSRNNAVTQFPGASIVRSYEELLKNPEIELVIVNTPDHLHLDMCRQALEAGKHVVLEKPFTQHVPDALHLIKLAREMNRVLTVFQNRRWDSDFMTVRQVMQSGQLGRVVYFESHFDRYRNYIQESWKEDPAAGTGTLYNLGSHLIDQALQLFGKPDGIFADLRKMRDGARVDDFFDLSLNYPGVKVRLCAGYLFKEPGPKFQVHGTHGSFLKWGADIQEEELKKGVLPGGRGWGLEPEASDGYLNSELTEEKRVRTLAGDYPAFYRNLYEVIRNDAALQVKPEEATLVISVIEAAMRSQRERREILL